MGRKILVLFPESDLRRIDAAARRTGESRSAFLRRAAKSELERQPKRPIDDPKVRHAFEQLMRLREKMPPMTTGQFLKARDKGRRF
jgi:metal-responsive CopG/Arc/MetJ family transcriptional regulator